MPAITQGSEKQIVWATTIVEEEVARINRLLAPSLVHSGWSSRWSYAFSGYTVA